MRKTPPAGLQREGDISEVDSRMSLQIRGEIHSRRFESGGGFRRESQKLEGTRGAGFCFDTRGFFQNNVRVRSTDAERTHSRTARSPIRLPFGQLRVDEERRVGKINIRIRPREIKTRR